jgi:hypothetical protein
MSGMEQNVITNENKKSAHLGALKAIIACQFD